MAYLNYGQYWSTGRDIVMTVFRETGSGTEESVPFAYYLSADRRTCWDAFTPCNWTFVRDEYESHGIEVLNESKDGIFAAVPVQYLWILPLRYDGDVDFYFYGVDNSSSYSEYVYRDQDPYTASFSPLTRRIGMSWDPPASPPFPPPSPPSPPPSPPSPHPLPSPPPSPPPPSPPPPPPSPPPPPPIPYLYTNSAETLDAATGLVLLKLFRYDSLYAPATSHALAHAATDEPRLCLLFLDSCSWTVSVSGEANVTLGPNETFVYVLPYDTTKGVALTDFIGRYAPYEPNNNFTASFVWSGNEGTFGALTRERTRKGTTWDPSFLYRTSMRLVGNDTVVAKNVVAPGTALERTAPFVYSLDCTLPSPDCEFTIAEGYGDNHSIVLNASWIGISGVNRYFAIVPHETKIGQVYTYPYDAYVSLPYESRDDASHITYLYNGFRLAPYISLDENGNLYFSLNTFNSLEG